MLCACSGEQQFKVEEAEAAAAQSVGTRDFSASGISSTTGGTGTLVDWESNAQVDEAESTLKEALSLNYEVYILQIVCLFAIHHFLS